MAIQIKLNNNTGNNIIIKDLGIVLQANSETLVFDSSDIRKSKLTISDLVSSHYLLEKIISGDVTLGDDLDIGEFIASAIMPETGSPNGTINRTNGVISSIEMTGRQVTINRDENNKIVSITSTKTSDNTSKTKVLNNLIFYIIHG